MAKLHSITIKNFRGIKYFEHKFYSDKFICLIGKGDSGKSTILEAISYVLSPNWNITFYDSDFYNCNTNDSIVIEATLINLPEYFLNEKYGLHLRGFDFETGEINDILEDKHEHALTIRLEVKNDLEPNWSIINKRQEPINVSATARSKLNVYIISDFTDQHFAWSKGKPLYSLLRQENNEISEEDKNIIINALREAKKNIDLNSFNEFKSVIDTIINFASELGLDIGNTKTTIDFKDLSIKDNRVCLHDDNVPFRLKGKGSKRLISIAIQSAIAKLGGIMLIDEIEQGLEPYRIKHLARTLNKNNEGQILISSHSQNVIEEIDSNNILRIEKDEEGTIKTFKCDENYQNIVRACPEALFAKKVIVCEGKTEIGICRALDVFRKSKNQPYMASKDVIYTLGAGDCFTERAIKLKRLGLNTCVFCDSDKDKILKPCKNDLIDNNINIFDCEENNSIEYQVLSDLPWEGILDLVNYKIREKGEESIIELIKNQNDNTLPTDWKEKDTVIIRNAIAKAATFKLKKNGLDKSWFKRIDHGEYLGNIIFKYWNDLDNKKLKSQIEDLSKWIDSD